MDINPKRTFMVVGIAALVSGGILYHQESSYSPSAEQEARADIDKAKKSGSAEIVPRPPSGSGGVIPPVAKSGPSPTPVSTDGLFGINGGFGYEVGPEMTRALKNRTGQPSTERSGGGRKSGGYGGSGGSSGSSGGGSSGGGSSGGYSGGSSGGGTSGGGTSGGDPEEGPNKDGGYWLDDGTNIRHNSSCEFYKAESGRPSGADDGVACRRCGG